MRLKGFMLTATTLAWIIFIIAVLVVILMLFGSFSAEAGRPASEFFFKVFDFMTGFIS